MISKLPWKYDYFDAGTGESEQLAIYGEIPNSIVVEAVAIVEQPNITQYIAGDNAKYIVDVCNLFPELVKALDNMSEDCNYGVYDELINKAKQILENAGL